MSSWTANVDEMQQMTANGSMGRRLAANGGKRRGQAGKRAALGWPGSLLADLGRLAPGLAGPGAQGKASKATSQGKAKPKRRRPMKDDGV